MKGFLIITALVLALTGLVGCANLVAPVNPFIAQPRCVTHDECEKAYKLHLPEPPHCSTHEECLKLANLPSPTNFDRTFVIEKKEFHDMVKGPRLLLPLFITIGYKPLSNMKYDIYIDICVAKALAQLYPSSRILFGTQPKDTDIYISGFRDLDSKEKLTDGITTTFKGDVRIDGAEKNIVAKGDSIIGTNATARACISACIDFAKQVKMVLDQETK